MDARAALALAAMFLVSSATGQQSAPGSSEAKGGATETEISSSKDTLQRYIEYAKREAERQRQACEAAVAEYQAQCPIRGKNPFFQNQECKEFQDHIRRYCYAELRR
jgi:hypothetical protein